MSWVVTTPHRRLKDLTQIHKRWVQRVLSITRTCVRIGKEQEIVEVDIIIITIFTKNNSKILQFRLYGITRNKYYNTDEP